MSPKLHEQNPESRRRVGTRELPRLTPHRARDVITIEHAETGGALERLASAATHTTNLSFQNVKLAFLVGQTTTLDTTSSPANANTLQRRQQAQHQFKQGRMSHSQHITKNLQLISLLSVRAENLVPMPKKGYRTKTADDVRQNA